MSMTRDTYLLTRGVAPSIRLLAQHWLWKDLFGWNLHPTVKQKWMVQEEKQGHSIPRMIADVATGNAIWLLEEASELPPGSKAFAFDISNSMAPAPHTLPSNVAFAIFDAAAELPKKYLNAFDVVHVRLLIAAVYNNDPRPILRNMIRMLKPGGMLQWGEIMPNAYVLGKTQDGRMTASRKVMRQLGERTGTAQLLQEELWLERLPKIFEECGLHDVKCIKGGEPRQEMWKFWGEVCSAAMEEIIAGSGLGGEYLSDLAKERECGEYVYVEPRIVTGWKAGSI